MSHVLPFDFLLILCEWNIKGKTDWGELRELPLRCATARKASSCVSLAATWSGAVDAAANG